MTEREKNKFTRSLLQEYMKVYMNMFKEGEKEVKLDIVLMTLKDLHEILSKGIG